MSDATRDLSGLRVVETATGLAGPLAARMLAECGADVIKIESRHRPDINRSRVPPRGMSAQEAAESYPAVHETAGGKRSVALNLKHSVGQELFLRLLAAADVYIENFAPGWLERLGLSLAAIRAVNPRLVVLSQSAYGGEGPSRDQRAYAPIMTALAGIESIVGYADGRVTPQISSAVGDIVAAHFGTVLALAVLQERESSGHGALIDMSQIEASAAMGGLMFAEYGLTGEVPRPHGNRSPLASPHGIYPVAGDDQWLAISVDDDEQWSRLCARLGVDAALRDTLATTTQRLDRVEAVDALVAGLTRGWDRDELFQALQADDIAATPVLSCYEADDWPGLVARGVWVEREHPRLGPMRITGIPWSFENTVCSLAGVAEPVGASTADCLRSWLHASDEQVTQWQSSGGCE